MEGHLDQEDITLFEGLAENETIWDCYMRMFQETEDKTTLRRYEMAGGRRFYEGCTRKREGHKVIISVCTGS